MLILADFGILFYYFVDDVYRAKLYNQSSYQTADDVTASDKSVFTKAGNTNLPIDA